jgi:hypothetical protein
VSTLPERLEAALRVLREDPAVDRLLLLEQVVWPSQAVTAAVARRPQRLTDAELEHMRALSAAGLSHRQIGERLGRARTTVSETLRRERKRGTSEATG